jgi:hypothetical protein
MKPPPNRVCGFLLRFLLQRSFVATPCRSSLTRGTCVVSTGGLVQRGAASHARRVGRAASARPPPYRRGAGRVEADRAARRTSAIRSRACVGVPTLYSDANVANRNVRGYGRVGPAHVYLHAARHTLRRFASPSHPPPPCGRRPAANGGCEASRAYGDEKVANRDIRVLNDIRVWHGATEKGP